MQDINYYLDSIINAVLCIKEINLSIKKRQQVIRLVDLKKNEEARAEYSSTNFYKKKELIDMPLLKEGKMRFVRGIWEIRYRKNGYDKSFSSKLQKDAIAKFKTFLEGIKNSTEKRAQSGTLDAWMQYSFAFKKKQLKEISYRVDYHDIYINHIQCILGALKITKIKAFDIQALFDNLAESKMTRIAEKVRTVLNYLFESALNNDIISKNPMLSVNVEKHYRIAGTSLTPSDEIKFIKQIKGNYFELVYLFMLFTGARTAEALLFEKKDIDLERNIIKLRCAKVKHSNHVIYREIPINRYLMTVIKRLPDADTPLKCARNRLSVNFKNFVGAESEYTLKSLRHTFISRCKECGVNPELVATWAGHDFEGVKRGRVTSTVYTHFSEEYQQKECQKLRYLDVFFNDLFPNLFPKKTK